MRLCNIKLSGFKSFVDHTNLIIPGNLVGVVGPNGCGKSNIIDAVTWVMGESSAKHLRGESLTDVIFSGSSARQPVGQASVELVFDNTEKKLGGQYASYNEISVKRQINRDGISTYFLNGTRCRRRDITAIFLGTGLGPRSYAIIEQGMISRLIEAKPEELRVYIEEAAGISKYRERRRETENRIKHTKENLDRLNDIREELEKQLNHLQRQAKAAERYKELKKEERQVNAELLALTWRDMNKEMQSLNDKAGQRQNEVEAAIARIREVEAEIEKQREALSDANNTFNDKQSEFYRVGSDIAQYEQQIQHTREKIENLESERSKAVANQQSTQEQQRQDKAELEKLMTELSSLEPRLQGSRTESNKAYEILNQSEEAMQQWQSEWEQFNHSFAEFSREEHSDQTRQELLHDNLLDIKERRHQLQAELDRIEATDTSIKLNELTAKLQVLEQQHGIHSSDYSDNQSAIKQQREKVRQLSQQLDSKRNEFQRQQGQLASLETLQKSTVEENEELQQWLHDNNLDNFQRLAQQFKVDDKWAHALETVTSTRLNHICVENIEQYLEKIEQAPGKFGLISQQSTQAADASIQQPRLLDYIQSSIMLPSLLNSVYAAEDLNEAVQVLKQLPQGASVVTTGGIWLSHDWVIINNSSAAADTVISREKEIESLRAELSDANAQLTELENELRLAEQTLEQSEHQQEGLQGNLTNAQHQIADLRAELAACEALAEQNTRRHEELVEELSSLDNQEQGDTEELEGLAQRLQELQANKQQLESQKTELSSVRDRHRSALDDARSRWQSTHEESHGIALQLESYSSRRASYEQAIKRNDIQLQHLDSRLAELEEELQKSKQPLTELQASMETALGAKLDAEKALAEARSHMHGIEASLREMEQGKHRHEQELEEKRASLEKARIDVNGCQVRLEAVVEKLAEFEQSAEALLQNLAEDADQSVWKEQLEALGRKIQRLGAINLAAIDEYAQSAERKTYLDSQHKDLTEALETLESAIRKIDKETRTRFKETFDELNTNIKDMFPKLFGGGHAYLELTGEDLLQTGVAIMARPPGKKNSNIHLLSGGEKALTAVALVFAIFKLNPAPFCILDEVDAPLDDTNVGRFSELVKSMSDEVQFIFITHNKITMEIANQLMGVTMHEAGVSRLVSVDVDEAVEMAATA